MSYFNNDCITIEYVDQSNFNNDYVTIEYI